MLRKLCASERLSSTFARRAAAPIPGGGNGRGNIRLRSAGRSAEGGFEMNQGDARPLGVARSRYQQTFEFRIVARIGPLDELVEGLLFNS
jgi:hypothetical protein